MNVTHNERLKLLANALDRAGTSCFTVGIAAPAAGAIYGYGFKISDSKLVVGIIAWLLAALILHLGAQIVLRRLK